MAFTFTTLKQAIQDYLESDETTLVNNLPTIITQAEERILKTVQLPNFRKNVTGTTTQSNSYLETPSDFLAPYSLAVDNSGYEYLMFKDVNFIRQHILWNQRLGYPSITLSLMTRRLFSALRRVAT